MGSAPRVQGTLPSVLLVTNTISLTLYNCPFKESYPKHNC